MKNKIHGDVVIAGTPIPAHCVIELASEIRACSTEELLFMSWASSFELEARGMLLETAQEHWYGIEDEMLLLKDRSAVGDPH